jgi:phosphoglycolate phosphatase-like HAD superfamily hydrolase
MTPRAVLWDVDGSLIDSEGKLISVARHTRGLGRRLDNFYPATFDKPVAR